MAPARLSLAAGQPLESAKPMTTIEIRMRVGPEYDGWRLDSYVAAKIPRLSRARARRLLEDGIRSPPGRRLRPGSVVREGLTFSLVRPAPDEPPPPEVPVVFEDFALVVLDKPPNLAIHPTARYHRQTLTGFLRGRPGEKADPAHRIDRETSGLVLCGKGVHSARLKAAFARGEVEKRYLAIAAGWPKEERFAIDLPLALGSGAVRVRMEVGSGKPSRTEVELLRRFERQGERFSLFACRPRSGRQHQIRAHLSAVGHPIVGDKIYGPDEGCFIRFTEGRLSPEDLVRLRLSRHALHAERLAFAHPATGERLEIASPLPADLERFLAG